MTPENQDQIVSLIEAAKQTGSDVASFIQQQAPEAIEQLVRWKIVEGVADMAVGSVLLWAAIRLFRITWKKSQARELDEFVWMPAGLAVVAMCIMGFLWAYSGANKAAKAVFAPKILIVEEIATLARK